MSIVAPTEVQKLEAIRCVLRAIRAASRRCMQTSIQGLLDSFVVAGLALELTPWQCQRCGSQEPATFRRNGVYHRKLATLCGVIELDVPRLRCRCGAHVKLSFPVLEPRKRHWWDVWLEVVEGIGERVSVWHLRDRLLRRGVYLSRSTIVRWLADMALPPLGAIPGRTDEIQVDGLYGHLWGPLPQRWRDHTYALLFAVNRDPACPEKVLGAVLAKEEDTEGYRSLADLLLNRGLNPEAPLTVTSDGAQSIRAGLGISFPRAQFVRCLWHLSRLVADLAPAELRDEVRRDCRHVLRAQDWDKAVERYQRFREKWLERAPDSCRALADGFEDAMLPLVSETPVRQRTNGLAERIAREFRRFLRPREALRSTRTAPALVALALAQINARHKREDWLPAFLGAALGWPQRLTEFRVPLHT
jgi:transposase-like protein